MSKVVSGGEGGRRVESPGYGPWTVKAGIAHVRPPIGVLEGMLTLRVHLDDCGPGRGHGWCDSVATCGRKTRGVAIGQRGGEAKAPVRGAGGTDRQWR